MDIYVPKWIFTRENEKDHHKKKKREIAPLFNCFLYCNQALWYVRMWLKKKKVWWLVRLFQCHWMLYNKYYMAAIAGQWDKTFINATQQGNACAITSLEAGFSWNVLFLLVTVTFSLNRSNQFCTFHTGIFVIRNWYLFFFFFCGVN